MANANATALSGRSGVQISIDSKKVDTAKLAETLDKLGIDVGIDWLFGTGPNKADLLYHAKDLLAETGTTAVDISGTDIKDAYGIACDFSLLKLLFIHNKDATEDLKLGGVALHLDIFATIADDVMFIKPGGFLLWVDPIGLDVKTNLKLQLQAETAHVLYDIVLMGEKTP